jgi:signal peptidase I
MSIPMILVFVMIVIYFISLPKIFQKAGRKDTWAGYVPIYNLYVWLQVLKKPWWWMFFFLAPIYLSIHFSAIYIDLVLIIVTVGLNVETGRLFGKYDAKSTVLNILLPWYYIPFLAFKEENKVVEPTNWENAEDVKKRSLHDQLSLFFISLGIGNVLVALFSFTGSKSKPGKKTMAFEWTNALGFAIVAATIIRTFAFEAFTIPTGSMEKTMRIGDYLFVNKWKYGPRVPMKPISLPFVHNRLPFTFAKSYVDIFEMDYHRLPGYGEMKRGEIMVFNWPVGDSVLLHDVIVAHDYYQIVRDETVAKYILLRKDKGGTPSNEDFALNYANAEIPKVREHLISGGGLSSNFNGVTISKTNGLQTLSLDKKENYIKRCVAQGGDILEIKNGQIFINNEKQETPPEAQFTYFLYSKNSQPGPEYYDENFDIYFQDFRQGMIEALRDSVLIQTNVTMLTCTQQVAESLKKNKMFDSVVCDIQPKGYDYLNKEERYVPIYPNHYTYDWSRDNFGPLQIPAKGWKIELTPKNWILYGRAISAYEGNTVEVKKDDIYINGEKATNYTFKQNYYWMMGDNRHGSVDSRYWGFVGEDHIVGTASFVWMSKHPEKGWFSGGLRWDRVFSFVE